MEKISTETKEFVGVRELSDQELTSVCGGLSLDVGVNIQPSQSSGSAQLPQGSVSLSIGTGSGLPLGL